MPETEDSGPDLAAERARMALSYTLIAAGFIAGIVVWIATAALLWQAGDTGLMLLAIFVPPADLILAFVVSQTLGMVAIGATVALIVGAAISP